MLIYSIYIFVSFSKQLITFFVLLICPPVTDEDTVKRYYAKFEERFFQTCEKELLKINTFYSGIYLFKYMKSKSNKEGSFKSNN